MKETHRIVVPVDFLETTEKLVEYAAYMAEKLSAVIYFVHIVHPETKYIPIIINKLLDNSGNSIVLS